MDRGGAMLGVLRGLPQGLWRAFLQAVMLWPVLLFALLLAGCGGGGGDPGEGDQKRLAGPGNGALSVVIRGLPSGVPAAVRVTGPNRFSVGLSQSQAIVNLAPGTYEVAAAIVASGTATFTPSPERQSVQVGGATAATAEVTYSVSTPLVLDEPAHKFGRSPARRG